MKPSTPLSRRPRMSTSLRLDNHRVVTNPMEPRGLVGLFDPASGRYTAYVSAQSIHATRDHAARALGVEPAQLRFVAPDVGGGFGAKNFVYPEHVLLPGRRGGSAVRSSGSPAAARSFSPTTRVAATMPKRRWRSTPKAGSSRCASPATPISAPICRAAAAGCRPSSTPFCPARCTASRRSHCGSPASSPTPRLTASCAAPAMPRWSTSSSG